MNIEKVKARRIYAGDKAEPSVLALLEEEFYDEHRKAYWEDIDIDFFKWVIVAEYEEEVIGVITAQDYLPKKPVVTDCLVKDEYRGMMVLYVLWECFLTHLRDEGYVSVIGYPDLDNRGTVNTYLRVGMIMDPVAAIAGGVEYILGNTKQKLQQMSMIMKRRGQ